MTPDQARQLISEAAARVAPDADLDGLAPDADLRDGLELDSLDFLRLVEILSERTGRQITEDDYPQLATLASAIKFIAGGLSLPAVVLLGLAVLVLAKIGNHYLRQVPGAWAATLVALGVGAAWQGKVRSWPTAGRSAPSLRAHAPFSSQRAGAYPPGGIAARLRHAISGEDPGPWSLPGPADGCGSWLA